MDDRDIIKFVKGKKAILITEDKDFGELVFAHDFRKLSVVLLRYEKKDFPVIEKQLLYMLKTYYDKGAHVFITIIRTKVRITKI